MVLSPGTDLRDLDFRFPVVQREFLCDQINDKNYRELLALAPECGEVLDSFLILPGTDIEGNSGKVGNIVDEIRQRRLFRNCLVIVG
ncbi:MAG: hypothetical protein NTV68_04110 [Methanomicrobiales archaeon]|nr:hypothetical protein [Methanomicrobiales archaeon]